MRWAILISICFAAATAFSGPLSAREYRSREVTREFQREHPCPSTGLTTGACPGYRKDHIKALACGGPDAVSNMQWQTIADAKAKDRWERRFALDSSTAPPIIWRHTLDGADGDGAAADNIRELWAALRLIRETVEELAPTGSVPNDKYPTPEPMREAEAIIRGIHAIARSASPSA